MPHSDELGPRSFQAQFFDLIRARPDRLSNDSKMVNDPDLVLWIGIERRSAPGDLGFNVLYGRKNVREAVSQGPHRATASRRMRSRCLLFKPLAVPTSTFRSRSFSSSITNPA